MQTNAHLRGSKKNGGRPPPELSLPDSIIDRSRQLLATLEKEAADTAASARATRPEESPDGKRRRPKTGKKADKIADKIAGKQTTAPTAESSRNETDQAEDDELQLSLFS